MAIFDKSKTYSTDKQLYQHGYTKYLAKAKEYLDNSEKIHQLLKTAKHKAFDNQGALHDAWETLQLLFDALRSWVSGEYRDIPKGSILVIVATILYFVSPIDLIPDLFAGLGFFDDAAVIGFALKQIYGDLENFKLWRKNKDNASLLD